MSSRSNSYHARSHVPHRQVGSGRRGVELQLQGLVLPVEGCDSPRPDGGDEVPVVELPVKRENSVEVQGQTAAVVQHHPQFFPLRGG